MVESGTEKDFDVNSSYSCWLRYKRFKDTDLAQKYLKWCSNIAAFEDTSVIQSALSEVNIGINGMLGVKPIISGSIDKPSFIFIGTLEKLKAVDISIDVNDENDIGDEGFLIKSVKTGDKDYIIVTGKTDKGVLYGTFSLLRLISTNTELDGIKRLENPSNPLRIINHWDNIDGSVERGYAGKSIFYANNKITGNLKRIRDYGRLLASIGINGIAINNVNVHKMETRLIREDFLPYVARIANVFREYGIKTYLSINFAAPIEIGDLNTADPFDADVKIWWKKKAEEIYSYIPDFGGFLVKADSEFRPGPFTYNRNHADGANMLAEALVPYGGIVIWRCFVYNCLQDWRDRKTDRAKAAYDHFMPLDGMFLDNVILQIKNGPMDFQVREPVSPLFGGLKKTNTILELQVTQEYTGQQKHLCYLVPMWKEILDFDTYAIGKGSNVKKIVNGKPFNNKYGGIAAVGNVGDDMNWTGFQLAQSNLYGFGRLCWNPDLSKEEITDEWIKLTYSTDKAVVDTISKMLLNSWRIYENYTSPLGIGWMVNPNHHYGPNVDGYEYDKWGTYHRADCKGIGVDRTVKNGTGYTKQYHKENAEMYENLETCPEELLLFFHHVPYIYKLKSGETIIQHIYNTHFKGVEQAINLKEQWKSIKEMVDFDIYQHVIERLEGQIEHAKEWRDVINSYFYRKTGIKDELDRTIY
ncbi:alpha-glucuronidase family glycosyl hydrolase [Pseudobacteroides cellulosolvens]|uniref:Xylan alpha-1,2-glucuronidase n=1 Tax=Pseudobacteroides cellulosolvens ATCC 35603 = DSM 2933 TaxID=398512 RepID=A0A0L6JQG1_9FIRM|nr:alpha-glucuronidase family glycosyl hydrolase [Pseudobacteroides cellulosolvens]KNY28028.1 Alpha-glucuronidase [Pseudobacteroides cellulosolvens ATCC 35603 = DSM 2933]